MKDTAHCSFPLFYDQFISELFAQTDEMRNLLLVNVQKSNYHVTKNNANF